MAEMLLGKLSDEKLYKLCREYGSNSLRWRWRFAGLLPEVLRRRLYEKKGFRDIEEFAARLAGMSREQVQRVLQLERKFEDKPVLQALLVEGEVSANKLARIASIATTENQEDLANMTKIISNRAIETFVRDEQRALKESGANTASKVFQSGLEFESQNGLNEPKNEPKSVHVHNNSLSILPYVKILEKLSPEIKEKLLELVNKEIDVNGLIAQMLQNREAEIAAAKEQIVEEMEAEKRAGAEKGADKKLSGGRATNAKKPSRYIPVKIKKIIKLEQGTRCSFPGCENRAENIHHTQRFAITGNNNPFFLANACKAHHEIAHTIDVKCVEIKQRARWRWRVRGEIKQRARWRWRVRGETETAETKGWCALWQAETKDW
jgi:hypothetical protein